MVILEFKKLNVPEEYQDFLRVKFLYNIKYLKEIYGSLLKHNISFKSKQELIKFCDENKITKEKLKEVWVHG